MDKNQIIKMLIEHEGEYYICGPGKELGRYSKTLFPDLWFSDVNSVKVAQKIANITYEEGYKQAQRDIRKSLGIKP